MDIRRVTAVIERKGDGYVALCPEFDIASQGDSIEDARQNLREAVELLLKMASGSEIDERWHAGVYVTHLDIAVDQAARLLRASGLPPARPARLRQGAAVRQPHRDATAHGRLDGQGAHT